MEIFSTTGICKWHGIDPFHYLADVRRRLPPTPPEWLTELLPGGWFLAHWNAARNRAE